MQNRPNCRYTNINCFICSTICLSLDGVCGVSTGWPCVVCRLAGRVWCVDWLAVCGVSTGWALQSQLQQSHLEQDHTTQHSLHQEQATADQAQQLQQQATHAALSSARLPPSRIAGVLCVCSSCSLVRAHACSSVASSLCGSCTVLTARGR